MFGIGGFELFIILVFGFLLFGPDKLPEIAKTVGRGIARFRDAQQEMNETLGGEKIFDPNNPDEPFKDPVEVLDRIAQKQEDRKAGKTRQGAGSASASAQAETKEAATQASADTPASSGAPAAGAGRQESFTERKARYERERAARKAEAAERDAGAAASTVAADAGEAAVGASADERGDA